MIFMYAKAMPWIDFEKNVTDYLSKNIDTDGIEFIQSGGSNANEPDINVFREGCPIFSIECKKSTSQSSQFVLIDKNNSFEWSDQNTTDPISTEKIIDHMNDHYPYYSKTKENGSINNELICGKDLMFDRVINHLKSKSKLVASSDHDNGFGPNSYDNPLSIFHIDDMKQHFEISGTYRTKRSGTSPATEGDLELLPDEIYPLIRTHDGRFHIYDPNKERGDYHGPDNTLFLSKTVKVGGLREIRKRSMTNNANVIFTLKLKQGSKIHSGLGIVRECIFQCK